MFSLFSQYLSQIVFMQPIILAALMALPILWYLLRVTPPAPKNIFFPATRFLANLNKQEQTPSKTPWWILLLRLIIAALVIIALARPVINPSDNIAGRGSVRIIIDNDWASAQNWSKAINTAQEIIAQAGREGRNIYLLPTTSDKQYGALNSSDALALLRGFAPKPWRADYNKLSDLIKNTKTKNSIYTMWLGHGLKNNGMDTALKAAQSQGGISYISPSLKNMPLLLRPVNSTLKKGQSDVRINLDAPDNIDNQINVTVQAMGQGGDIIDVQQVKLDSSRLPKTIEFNVLENFKNKITKFKISGANKGAGAIYLLDEQFKKRKVGIAAPTQKEQSAPLIEESYYIKRAIEPYANIKIGAIHDLLNDNLSVIFLPDIAAMPSDTLNKLEKWVKEGGLLVRFAGDKMAKSTNEQFLLPVILRSGGRSLSGSMSWEKPQKIANFAQNSPFYGLKIPDDISINQQILADPSQDLEGKIWASLEDGTPFITANTMDEGMIVLIHTSANTSWSNFAISGLYVSILKRIIKLAGSANNVAINNNYKTLDPILIMDGFGNLNSPDPSIKPLSVDKLDKTIPTATHPPGIYGKGKIQYVLNIGTNAPKLRAVTNLPIGVIQKYYDKEYEIDIKPIILSVALALFLLDWLVMIFIAGNISKIRGLIPAKTSIIFIIIIFSFIHTHAAIANDSSDIRYSSNLYLAYIKTGDSNLDRLAQRGLESLSKTLKARTSVEPAGVAALNPENDELAFFPLIYWAVSAHNTKYSDKAMQNIQSYLDHGGTILFDTRDQNQSISKTMRNTENAKALRLITSSLNIPAIVPIPKTHVLGRSFYLLDKYPGRYSSGTLWVEKYSISGRDNVSSVIIGSNDWIGSWADSYDQKEFSRYSMNPTLRQKELSLRFGVNLVMYALTGNYKSDQVHIPHILKRLGK